MYTDVARDFGKGEVMSGWVNGAGYVIIIALLILVSARDILWRRIDNRLTVTIGVISCVLSALAGYSPNILLFLIILFLGFLLSTVHIIGGGDVKLISALSLLYTPSLFYQFLITMAIFGGVVAIIGLLFFYENVKKKGIPYGVAISLAFIFSYPIY